MFAPVHTGTTRGRWISRLRFRHWNAPSYNHGAVLPFPLTDSFCDASLPVYTPFSASFLVFRGRRLRNWMQQSSSLQQEVSVSCHIFVASFRRTLLRFPFNCFLDNIPVERNIREESTCRSYSSWLSSIRAASCHSRHFGGCWQIEPDRAVVRYNTILNQALPWKVCLSGPHTGILLWSGSHCSQFCLFKYFKFLARKKLAKILQGPNFGGGRTGPTCLSQHFADWHICHVTISTVKKTSRALIVQEWIVIYRWLFLWLSGFCVLVSSAVTAFHTWNRSERRRLTCFHACKGRRLSCRRLFATELVPVAGSRVGVIGISKKLPLVFLVSIIKTIERRVRWTGKKIILSRHRAC